MNAPFLRFLSYMFYISVFCRRTQRLLAHFGMLEEKSKLNAAELAKSHQLSTAKSAEAEQLKVNYNVY